MSKHKLETEHFKISDTESEDDLLRDSKSKPQAEPKQVFKKADEHDEKEAEEINEEGREGGLEEIKGSHKKTPTLKSKPVRKKQRTAKDHAVKSRPKPKDKGRTELKTNTQEKTG